MKTVIFGDIHGRTIWKNILEKEQPNKVIFLGDYVSSHEGITEEQQISNLLEILDYKEANADKVIMLRGNHDMEALGYHWAECYPCFYNKKAFLNNGEELKKRYLKDTQWIYIDGTRIYSHAGVSQTWFDTLKERYPDVIKTVADINLLEPCKEFGFTAGPDNPFDNYGGSIYQPCTWIRPTYLIQCAVEGTHIIGHTNISEKVECLADRFTKDDEIKNVDIWTCDTLAFKSYLIFENDNFKVKTYE